MGRARTASLTALLAGLSLAACSTSGHPSAATPSPHGILAGQQYVALGDSYTAAPGIGTTIGDDGCFRSAGNYPALIAEQTGATLVDRSCSGANTPAIDGPQITLTRARVPPQDAPLGDSTALVTIGIGANDFTLFNLISTVCPRMARADPTGRPCTRANAQAQLSLADLLTTVQARIEGVVRVVQGRAPHARVMLVGYPSVVPAEGTCAALPLAAGDYPFARSILTGLDRAMSRAAAATGATYVDTAGPTAGHDICSSDPWIAGATAAKGAGAPWHPYAAEQREVARLIVQELARP